MKWYAAASEDELLVHLRSQSEFRRTEASATFDEMGHELATISIAEHGFGPQDTLWERTREEFRALVCEHSDKYRSTRLLLDAAAHHSTATVVATISLAIAHNLQTTENIVAPFVTLLLLAMVRFGHERLCSMSWLSTPVAKTHD